MKLRLGFLRRRSTESSLTVRPQPQDAQKWALSFADLMASKCKTRSSNFSNAVEDRGQSTRIRLRGPEFLTHFLSCAHQSHRLSTDRHRTDADGNVRALRKGHRGIPFIRFSQSAQPFRFFSFDSPNGARPSQGKPPTRDRMAAAELMTAKKAFPIVADRRAIRRQMDEPTGRLAYHTGGCRCEIREWRSLGKVVGGGGGGGHLPEEAGP